MGVMPSTHDGQLRVTSNSSSKRSEAVFWIQRHLHSHVHTSHRYSLFTDENKALKEIIGAGEMFRDLEYWLLFQKLWIPFSAPNSGSQLYGTSILQAPASSSSLLGHCTHADHRHTWRQNTHTHKKKRNKESKRRGGGNRGKERDWKYTLRYKIYSLKSKWLNKAVQASSWPVTLEILGSCSGTAMRELCKGSRQSRLLSYISSPTRREDKERSFTLRAGLLGGGKCWRQCPLDVNNDCGIFSQIYKFSLTRRETSAKPKLTQSTKYSLLLKVAQVIKNNERQETATTPEPEEKSWLRTVQGPRQVLGGMKDR